MIDLNEVLYRYVTEGGMRETAIVAGLTGPEIEKKHFQTQARTKLYSPGQPIAMELAKNPTVLIVNRTMFAHGGVLPSHGKSATDPLSVYWIKSSWSFKHTS